MARLTYDQALEVFRAEGYVRVDEGNSADSLNYLRSLYGLEPLTDTESELRELGADDQATEAHGLALAEAVSRAEAAEAAAQALTAQVEEAQKLLEASGKADLANELDELQKAHEALKEQFEAIIPKSERGLESLSVDQLGVILAVRGVEVADDLKKPGLIELVLPASA